MENITKIKAEFKIEKKKHLLIEWTFFTNIQIICQIEARQRFLPYHACLHILVPGVGGVGQTKS